MDRSQLEKIIPVLAQKHNFRLEVLEKDYYLTVILNNIEKHLSDRIVFKGGSLLNKIHLNYHRLSEDLDFVYGSGSGLNTRSQRSKAISPIRDKMEGFLKTLELKSDKPQGQGYNDSRQYIFYLSYPSFVTAKEESIKIEVSLRQYPLENPVHNVIKHFYQDPFTGENLIPSHKILSLSFKEAVAEKLKAAITRKDAAIRDYYDLWHIYQAKFDFFDKKFITLFKKKLIDEGYRGNFRHSFGLKPEAMKLLHRQVESDLVPVIRLDEHFDLDKAFDKFNDIFKDKRFAIFSG